MKEILLIDVAMFRFLRRDGQEKPTQEFLPVFLHSGTLLRPLFTLEPWGE